MKKLVGERAWKVLTGVTLILVLACYLFATGAVAQKQSHTNTNSAVTYKPDHISYGDIWAFDYDTYAQTRYSLKGATEVMGYTNTKTADKSDSKTYSQNYFQTLDITGGNLVPANTIEMKKVEHTSFISNVVEGEVSSELGIEGLPSIPVIRPGDGVNSGIYSVVPNRTGKYYVHVYVDEPSDSEITLTYALLDSCEDTNAFATNGFGASSGIGTVSLKRIEGTKWYRGVIDSVKVVTWYAIQAQNDYFEQDNGDGSNTGSGVHSGRAVDTQLTLGGSTYYYNKWTITNAYYNTVLAIQIPASGVALGPISSEGSLAIGNNDTSKGTLTAYSIFGEVLDIDGSQSLQPNMHIALSIQANEGSMVAGFVNGEDSISEDVDSSINDTANSLKVIAQGQTYIYLHEGDNTPRELVLDWAEPKALPTITVSGDNKAYNFISAREGQTAFVKGTRSDYTISLDFADAADFQSATYSITGDIINGQSSRTGSVTRDNNTIAVTTMYDKTVVKITAIDNDGVKYNFTYTFGPSYSGNPVAVNMSSNKEYYFVEDALMEAGPNQIIKLLRDASFVSPSSNNGIISAAWQDDQSGYTVDSEVTLLVPYSDSDNGSTVYSEAGGGIGKVARTLTVPADINLVVNGNLIVNAVQGHTNTRYMGNITGNYGKLLLEGNVDVNSGGVLKARGIISGSGCITANSGADVYQLLQITDFRGGRATASIYASVFPLNQFYLQNIQCKTKYYGGAELFATYFVYAADTAVSDDACLVGGSQSNGALFRLTDENYVEMSYSASNAKTIVDFYGNATLDSFGLSLQAPIVGNISMETSKYDCPISGAFECTIKSGSEVTIPNRFKMLPGSKLTIEDGAKLQVTSSGKVYLYDIADYNSSADVGVGYSYLGYRSTPTTSGLSTLVSETDDAVIVVNGTLVVDGQLYCSNGADTASSSIRTSAATGEIKMNSVSSNKNLKEGVQESSGATTTNVSFGAARGSLVGTDKSVYTAFDAGTWYSNGEQWYRHNIIINGVNNYTTAETFPLNAETLNAACGDIVVTGGTFDKTTGNITAMGKEVVVTMKAHTEGPIAAVEPDCITPGAEAGTECTVCHKVLSGCAEIPAKGHTTGDWEYDENGHWKFCSVCETRQEEGTHSYAEDTNQCVCGRIGAFTITFVNEDGSVLQSSEVAYGTMPAYEGATPTKEATAQYTYSFAGWTPEIVEVTGEATYTATYTGELNSYTVTWIVDGAKTEETYKYGDTPSFKGSTDKAADAKYTYSFEGWDSEPASVTGDITYTAKFNSTVNEYTVTFYDEDGTTVLQSGKVPYGTVPTAPEAPTKEATAKYTYTFDGWNAELAEVTGDTSYTAKYSSVVNEYTITFYDEDGTTVLQSGKVAYDETPAYNGATPTKEGNAQFSYSFNAWSPVISAVTGDAEYTATYTETVNKYTVKFVNENGDVLQSSEVAYGDTPTYDGEEPTKEASAQYSYTFKGWNAEVVPVTGEATYTAQFESAVRSYTVTWIVNGVETRETYEYGAVPAFTGSTDKAADAQYSYAFAGWNTEPAEVTGDATYTATYSSTLRTYTVKFVNYDGTELQSEVLDYGETPEYKGETPTKAADAQYTYTFKEWDNQPSEVIADAIYKATYSETLNSYTVTFVDAEQDAEGNEVVLDTQTLNYGETPEYKGEIPTKAADAQYTYEFSDWSPAIEAVTGDVKYTAEYSKTVNKYTVTFVNYDGTVLQTGEVAYGEVPAYAGETPTKEADVHDTYSFAGWSPALAPVTGEITYTATFSETSQYYTVEFVNYDGTVLQSGEVEYDATPEYIGETPTKPATAQYSYEFIGWTPDVKPVNGKATYTAAYKEVVNEYTVTFVNDDGTELQSGKVAYGETPAYTGETPTKNPVKHSTYTFDKWTPEIAAVTGDATYKAVYTEVTGECEFTTEIERVDASCTGPGYYVMQCSCGDTKTFPIEQKAHTGTLQAGQAATCVADGWMDYYVCGGGCGKYFSDAECKAEIVNLEAWKLGDGKIAATGVHSFNEKASEQLASAADCVNAATYFVQCDNCDEVSAEKTVAVGEANGHSYGKPVFRWTATTETATSTATFACTECAEGTEGHAVTVDCSVTEQSRVDAKCDEAGSVTYAASVVFGGETYTASFDVEIPAQHVQLVEYPANPSTCENEGNEAYVECLSCGYSTYKQIPKLPHSFTVEVEGTRTDATCMAEGSVTMKCETCEATEVQTLEINAAAHEWGEVKHTWAEDHSSCTAERVCALNAEHTDTAIAEGEAISSEETKAPTCTEPGKTTYTANFGEGHWAGTASDEAEVKALGHDFGENKDAETCQRENCDEPNPELGESECEHEWKDATCTEPKHCELCGATEGETSDHSFGNGYVCKECGIFKFVGSSLTLGNSLDVTFGIPANAVDNWAGHYIELVRSYSYYKGAVKPDQVLRFYYDEGEWTYNGGYYVVTYPGFAAKEMCDVITATVYKGDPMGEHEAVSTVHRDSIKDYCMRMLEKPTSATHNAMLKTALVDMLNYGASAEKYFEYGLDDNIFANSDLTADQAKLGSASLAKVTDSLTGYRQGFLGTSLTLESRISMVMGVKNPAEGMRAQISYTGYMGRASDKVTKYADIEFTGEGASKVGVFTLEELVVADARCPVTVKVYNKNNTLVATFKDSVEAYVARMTSKDNGTLNNLLEDFMKFADSAKVYLVDKNT